MVRVRKRWNRQAPRSSAQMANAIAATIWKLAAEMVLNLENENFETETQAQRVDIVEEALCYLVHACDRWIYPRAGAAARAEFVSALAGDLARLLEESRVDVQGPGEYRQAFIDRLNRRSGDYSGFNFDTAEGASFPLRCRFGDHVQEKMGARDRRWIPDYVVGREAPEMESALMRALAALVSFDGESGGAD